MQAHRTTCILIECHTYVHRSGTHTNPRYIQIKTDAYKYIHMYVILKIHKSENIQTCTYIHTYKYVSITYRCANIQPDTQAMGLYTITQKQINYSTNKNFPQANSPPGPIF